MRAIKNIIGSVFISIAALTFWVFILPGYEMQSYLKSSIEVRSSALDSKSKLIQKVADLNKEYQSKFNELKRLSLVIPSEKNIAEIITSIEDISSQSGINLSDFTISGGSNSSNTKPYGVVSLGLSFSGNYESVLNLLAHIERHIRLIDATSLSVNVKVAASTESQIVLEASLKANMYYLETQAKEKSVTKTQTNIDANQ